MSINVTVNGNPISIRRGKMVLSDLENIKKTEREHRKRLRLEQVHEQSRALSKKLLERARQIQQEELNRLEHDANSEIRRAHDRRLMELNRRYQDIEHIGYAHENAAKQPDIESIKQVAEQRNRLLAKARGREAVQRFQESKNVVSPHSKQQERLRKVRDIENQRSCMLSQLPKKKSCAANVESVESSENEGVSKTTPTTSSSKIKKKVIVTKKSPIKKLSKQTKAHSTQTKTPSHMSICVNSEDKSKTTSTTTITSSTDKSKTINSNKLSNIPKSVSDIIQDANRIDVCESDDNEPRRTVPVICSKSTQSENLIRYNVENSSEVSSTSTTISSSTSDDSSYFSDSNTKISTVKKAPKRCTSPVSNKIDMYDHKTRQKLTYNTPCGVVERLNMKNKPNADQLAQEMIELETRESAALASQRESLRQRSQDAMLREKIRRDYETLLKNLDQLTKEERKLKASQVANEANQEQVPVPSKKSEDAARRQKKMDRAFQNILRSSRDPASCDNQVERPITITPHDYIHSERTPAPSWREPAYIDIQETEVSYSEDDGEIVRRIKISELLLKIEKLKKKLLQEYGANLPDDVFNASVKPLFNQSLAPASHGKSAQPPLNQTSPEIQVINMSSCNDAAKSKRIFTCSSKKTSNKVPIKKTTPKSSASNAVSTRDQQVQVELEQNKASEEVPKHPIEPVVKIVTPENVDSSRSSINNNSNNSSCSTTSSNSSTITDVTIDVSKKGVTVVPKDRGGSRTSKNGSTVTLTKSARCSVAKTPVKISFEQKDGFGSFEVAGLLIDPKKKEITVLPKKRKTPETVSRKGSPITSGKSVSLPGSRISSPSKKQSKSAPPSRHSSPKKSYLQSRHARTLEIQENNFEDRQGERYKTSVYTQVSIDSSTESSLLNSMSDNGNSKFCTRFQALAAQRIITRLQDTSDTSTTYASPPAPTAGAMINALNSTTPILELLDSSTNERIRRKVKHVSPVSSPETPSPRTMKLPSNLPRSDKVNKSLKFTSIINAQTKLDSNNISKSTRTTHSISKDQPTSSKSTVQSQACSCKNPNCKLLHDKLENLQSYAKHCPEILKKYDYLQNVCAERIASLTDLIEKVRNEQKGLELSVVTNEDSNSASQMIPHSQSSTSLDANKLAKEMEAVYTQLKKTLTESQRIISGEGIELPKPMMPYKSIEKSPTHSIDLSKDTTASESLDENAEKAKTATTTPVAPAKPRIVNSERVNIRLDRFRLGSRKSSGNEESSKGTTGAATTSGPSDVNDDMVKMLSNEILEQSKSLNKSVPVDYSKDSDDSLLKSSQALVKNSEDSSKNVVSNDENSQSANLESSNSDFVPLLAGIPKNPRALAKNSSTNGRGRPPVTLISGPYRPEILSPAHELSTIVEFDTPDTVNKSQVSTRSPSNRCRKKLPSSEDARSTTLLAPTKKTDVKLGKCKPSVHVAPLPAHRSPQLSHNVSNKLATKAIVKSPKKSVDKSFDSFEKKKDFKSQSMDSMHTLPDIHIEELQQSQDNADANYDFRISQISELHSLPDENIDHLLISEIHEESKSKSLTPMQKLDAELDENKGHLTSTSSRSISGLSGVSEITTTPSSDLSLFKYPSSPEEMELALKKLGLSGLAWAIPTLKKTREASALGSSSSSDVTPVNTATRLAPLTKKYQDSNSRNLLEISDVSSISMKHANKSTERSVLVKGRTSTPNRLSNTNSDGTVSTLGSFSSEMNIVVKDNSTDMTVPNISFSNNKLS